MSQNAEILEDPAEVIASLSPQQHLAIFNNRLFSRKMFERETMPTEYIGPKVGEEMAFNAIKLLREGRVKSWADYEQGYKKITEAKREGIEKQAGDLVAEFSALSKKLLKADKNESETIEKYKRLACLVWEDKLSGDFGNDLLKIVAIMREMKNDGLPLAHCQSLVERGIKTGFIVQQSRKDAGIQDGDPFIMRGGKAEPLGNFWDERR